MEELKDRITELANLMEEFKLSEAEFAADGFRVAFKKKPKVAPKPSSESVEVVTEAYFEAEEVPAAAPVAEIKPAGTPVTSPMTGIFYSSPSPGSPAFAKEGDSVTAGQPIGLIEAMKVFNEIPAPLSGTVQKVNVESGQLVNLGDVIMYIG